MKKVFFLFYIISSFTFAQQFVKNLKPFKSISINAAIDVELIPSYENKLEISSTNIAQLKILNSNDELVLDLPLFKKFSKAIAVKIYFQPGLRYLFAANNANIYSTVLISEPFLDIKAVHNTHLNLVLNVINFKADLNLGSLLTLSGTTDFQQINVANKATFDAFNFKSKKATIQCSSGNAAIFVTEFLNVNAKLKSEVLYAGNPAIIEQNTFLSNVQPKNN